LTGNSFKHDFKYRLILLISTITYWILSTWYCRYCWFDRYWRCWY